MIEFAYPSFLWGLVALFFLAVFGIGGLLLERRLQLRFAALTTLKRIKPEASGKRKLWQMFFSLLSIAFVLIALAAPRLRESKPSQQKGDLGVDVVFCLDISNSMGAEDLPPNRLVFAKQVVGYCMEKLEGSRVGLVLFAGGAYVRLPLTSDRIIARNMLQDVHQICCRIKEPILLKLLSWERVLWENLLRREELLSFLRMERITMALPSRLQRILRRKMYACLL